MPTDPHSELVLGPTPAWVLVHTWVVIVAGPLAAACIVVLACDELFAGGRLDRSGGAGTSVIAIGTVLSIPLLYLARRQWLWTWRGDAPAARNALGVQILFGLFVAFGLIANVVEALWEQFSFSANAVAVVFVVAIADGLFLKGAFDSLRWWKRVVGVTQPPRGFGVEAASVMINADRRGLK